MDLLFPRRCPWCGAVTGFAERCRCDGRRGAIRLSPGPIPDFAPGAGRLCGVYAPYRYEPPVRDAILRLKFEKERWLAGALAGELAGWFSRCGLCGGYDRLVPVPASAGTLKKRGYNQSLLLAQALGEKIGLPCDGALLHKVRETPAQRTLEKPARAANVKGAYRAAGGARGLRLLLVDDVVTTGSTLNECAAALLEAGAARCGGLCLAFTGSGNDFAGGFGGSLL